MAEHGTLEFRTADGPAFAAPLAQVGPVTWPWWWFGGGFVATVGGERFKVTFIRPNGAPAAPQVALADATLFASGLADSGFGPVSAAMGLRDVQVGRTAARRWRRVLGQCS